MSLQIQLLGQPRISRDGHPIDLPGYRPLALLAYLLITRKPQRRDQLIDLLFDGPDDPRAALRWTLSKLRKAIGSEHLLADQQEIAFNFQSEYWLDVAAFEAGENGLYQGDFLEGLYLRDAPGFEEWLLFERQRLRGKYQAVLEQQLELQRRQGDHAAAVLTAQGLLKLDNLREDWHYALIEAYARLGKRAAALEQYERCRQVLRAEWDVEPAPETAALAEAIQSGKIGTAIPTGGLSPGQSGAEERSAAPEKTPAARRRPGLSRAALALVGAIGLVVVSLLAMSRSPRTDSQAELSNSGQAAMASSTGEPGSLAGRTVWILGPFVDTYSKVVQQSMLPFEERSGINVVILTGEDDYDLDLTKRLESGDLPDIVVFPQPGWLADLAEQGKIVPISTFLDGDYLRQQYPAAYIDLVTVESQVLGIWHTVGLKSLVWYPKKAFEAKGYDVPETWDELVALSDRIVADGGVPWCIGIESAAGTGWVGTDWVEDILLRTAPPETYDAWVKHELPFNSPEIKRVFEIMGEIWLNEEYVYGGTAYISVENFSDSPAHLFEDPPGCYLHKQASFAPYFFPPGVRYGEDYDFFYLPPIDPQFGRVVLGSGDIFAMVKDRPEVREVMRYLTTAESTKALIQNGGFLSPHKDTPLDWFPSPADLKYAQIVLGADTYRFDGSDLMPGVVGVGSFYRGITDWVEGADLETVLQEIDESWPD